MTHTETALLILLVLSVCGSAVMLMLYLRNRKGQDSLAEGINRFIAKGDVTPFSTRDSRIARLQNSISELEELLALERSNAVAEARKNADFVADISHQLKTPLAGLRLYCEMEQAASQTAYTEKELELIEKMEKLIFSLLRLEKLRSDAYVMDFQDAELHEEFSALIDEYHHLFPEKKYSVTGIASLRCDKAWLCEAVGNIIKNASEHTAPDGKIRVAIEKSDKSVIITVEDDGGGLPEEQLPLVFKRFYRASDAAPDSAGIGLAITRAVVEKHHGTVSAENGRSGLRVTICLPVIDGSLNM